MLRTDDICDRLVAFYASLGFLILLPLIAVVHGVRKITGTS